MKKRLAKILAVVIVLLGLGFILSHTLLANKAQKQSAFIHQYARQHGLTQFKTVGDSGKGPDNATPWYQVYYKIPQSADSLKTSFEDALKARGYAVTDKFFDPIPCLSPWGDIQYEGDQCPLDSSTGSANNGGQSYLIIYGSASQNTVKAEITNISYTDASDTKNLYKKILGQHPVPNGYYIVNITVTSH